MTVKYNFPNECVYSSCCGIQAAHRRHRDQRGLRFLFLYSAVAVIRELFLDTVPNWTDEELQEIPEAYYEPEQQNQSQLLLWDSVN